MLRRAIEEPTERARISAVFNIFAFRRRAHRHLLDQMVAHAASPAGLLGRRQHRPGHVHDRGAEPAGAGPAGRRPVLIRLRQEEVQREIDSMRRYAHAI